VIIRHIHLAPFQLMIPRNLLSLLAPEQPINQDEQGGCVWCGGFPPGGRYGYAGRYLSDHKQQCPWVKARRLLGDDIPKERTL